MSPNYLIPCLVLLTSLSGCTNESTRQRSGALERLSSRASQGYGTALRKTRRLEGIPTFYAADKQASVRAFISGPSDLGGMVSVRGAKVVRYVVSNLQRRVNSKEEGVLVEAILTPDGDWPIQLDLQYSVGKATFDVVVTKWFAEDGMSRGYSGVSGNIALKEPPKKPVNRLEFSVVRGSEPGKTEREFLAIERTDDPPSTIRYVFH